MPLLPAARTRYAAFCAAATLALASGSLAVQPASAQPASGRSVSVHRATASGHGHHHHARPHRYLALGDSVAFGYRPPQVTPAVDYLDAANFRGYPEVLARHRGLRVTNASCPGETTASMLDVTAQSNGCANSVDSPVGYRTAYPLHQEYDGAQIDYAVHYLRHHRRTRLVSINIGANDLFVCQTTTPDQCTGTDFAATVATVQANLDTILSTLRHRGRYHHRLVVLTYYSLDYGDPVGTAAIEALNAGLTRAARANRAEVASGFRAFRAASASSGGDACAAGLIIKLPDGTCDVHPTAKGHRVLARAVARAARG